MGWVLRKFSKFGQVGLKINGNRNTFILLRFYYYNQLNKKNTNCSRFLYKFAYVLTLIFTISLDGFDGSRKIGAFIIYYL